MEVLTAQVSVPGEAALPGLSNSNSLDEASFADQETIRSLEEQQSSLQFRQIEVALVEARLWSAWGHVADRERALRKGLEGTRQNEIDALNRDKAIAEALAAMRAAGQFNGTSIRGVLLVCPVDAPRAYSDDFGAPRWGGGFHLHQGNDIFASLGTPIRSPFPGSAVEATNELGGLAVKVFGMDGYVYNAHLSALGTLGTVESGTIIGYVGNTGDAMGGPTHDHFEWHPMNGPAIDPFLYLNAVCL